MSRALNASALILTLAFAACSSEPAKVDTTADMAAVTVNIKTMLGCETTELIANVSDPQLMRISDPINSRLRSMLSAYAPPHSANSSSGINCTAPSIPTAKLDWVSA